MGHCLLTWDYVFGVMMASPSTAHPHTYLWLTGPPLYPCIAAPRKIPPITIRFYQISDKVMLFLSDVSGNVVLFREAQLRCGHY